MRDHIKRPIDAYTLRQWVVIRAILLWAESPPPRKRWPRYPVD